MQSLKLPLLASVAIALLPLPQQSLAQGVDQNSIDAFDLDPIIVTARKRAEELNEVPGTVSVVEGAQIGAGKTANLKDLSQQSPNVIFNEQGGPFTIRGVGSMGIDAGVDRQLGVGLFLDEVYVGRAWGFPGQIRDMERAEIVSGSQSTLYGKNTIGGAVNLITREPGEEFSAELEATLANHGGRQVSIGVDAPILDNKLLTRSYLSYETRDGYIDNTTRNIKEGDINNIFGRFTALGYVGDDTDIKFTLDYERDDDDAGIPYVPLNIAKQRQSVLDAHSERNLHRGGTSLRINHAFETVDLTSITAARAFEWDTYLDGDFSSAPNLLQAQKEKQWQVSQEIRLSSKTSTGSLNAGDWRWMAGLFYMYEDYQGTQKYDMASVPLANASSNTTDQKANSVSVFGEIGYQVTNQLDVTAGARLSYEHKDVASWVASPSGNNFFGAPTRVQDVVSFTDLSPEITFNYRWNDNLLTYAKVSRGFKSGGISQFVDAGDKVNRYDPEASTSLEVGAKSTWLDDRLSLSGAFFYTDWKDLQQRVAASPALPTLRVIRNAAAARTYGIELNAAFKMTPDLTINAGYGYLDAKFDDFTDPGSSTNFSGNVIPYSPRHSATAGLSFSRKIMDDMRLLANANYRFKSEFTYDAEGAYKQKATHLVDASVGLEKGRWTASLWGKNLFDETRLKGYFRSRGNDYAVPEIGRTFGITLKSKW